MTTKALERQPQPSSQTQGAKNLRMLWANKFLLFGGILTLFFVLVGMVGVVILAFPRFESLYLQQHIQDTLLQPLESGYPLGTDYLGRDMLWRLIAGAGVSLTVGFAVTALSMVVGMVLGAMAGYFGGLPDSLISGLIDLTWGFPVILVAVVFAGMLEPGLLAVGLAVGAVNWAGFARIIRAETLSLREREFFEAARALGVPSWKIILRHVFPHTMGTTLVMGAYYVAVTVIAEAGLSFIGLGAQPPRPSLGQMVASGREYLRIHAWSAFLPGTMIALIVLGLNMLGDGLRDISDSQGNIR